MKTGRQTAQWLRLIASVVQNCQFGICEARNRALPQDKVKVVSDLFPDHVADATAQHLTPDHLYAISLFPRAVPWASLPLDPLPALSCQLPTHP